MSRIRSRVQVRPLKWTKEKGLRFTHEMMKRPYLFDDFARENVALALAMLLQKPNVVYYEICNDHDFMGVIWFDPVIPKLNACVHTIIWDERAMGRPELAVYAALDCCRNWDLNRIQAFIPASNRLACRYAEATGMLLEGRLRQAVKMDGSYVDMLVYGGLWEEYSNADLHADEEHTPDHAGAGAAAV